MAKAFNLTAQINLQGPSNIGSVVGKIKKELGSVGVDVKLNINSKSVKSVDSLTSKLKVMNEVLMKSKNYTDGLNASLSQLSSSLNKTGGSTSKISKGLKRTASESLSAAKTLKQAEDAMTGLGKQAAVTIKRFAAFSIVSTAIYGVVNSVNQAYKAFLEFDKEMIRLQQITGSGAVAIGKLSATITELSTTLGVSSTELSRVAVTLAQAGFTASQTEQALSALAKTELAPSFDNLTRTTEGAIAAIRQFGLESKDLEKSLASINAVASRFAVESGDIIAAIQRTGGVFASASKGVSEGTDALNEFIAVFTSVRSTTRESAETIATGLRTIFTRIQRGSTIDYLKQFNIELQDSEGNFVGAYEAVKRLSEGLKGLDTRDVRFTRIVEELGGFRQIGKVIPLIQEFGTAQEALAVAQKGQGSLTEAAAKAQQSLIVQLAKVREEFNALIRSVGESKTFKTFLSLTLQTTRALIGLAAVFKPILPLLAILGTVKAVSSIGKFGAGFSGALKKGGGTKGVGQTIGEKLTGASEKEKSDAVSRAASATNQNTTALKSLTSAVNALTQKIGNLGGGGGSAGGGGGGGPILGPDGRPYRFATGGIVPGSGNRDTVPAMLTPGEFVIRKKAVETLGAGNLQKMNKYGDGGPILEEDKVGAAILKGNQQRTGSPIPITSQNIVNSFEGQKDSGKKNQLKKILGISTSKDDNIEPNKYTQKKYDLIKNPLSIEMLSGDKAQKSMGFESAILGGLKAGLNNAVKNIGKTLNISIKGVEAGTEKFFKRSLNSAAVGNLFEQVLTSIGNDGFWDNKQDKLAPFDFTEPFSGKLEELFPDIASIQYKDAKATYAAASKENFANKIGNQILRQNQVGSDPIKSKIATLSDPATKAFKRIKTEGINRGVKKLAGFKQLVEDGIVIQRDGKYEIDPQYIEETPQTVNMGGFIQKFAEGGSPEDTVPALLTPGEFVINKTAASKIGTANLNKMNRADKIQGFNRGGSVGFVQRFADGGAAAGGLGYPGSMPTSPAAEAAAAAEALEALKDAAKNAGMSVRRYEKNIKDQIKTLASSKVSEKEATRKDLAGILIRNRGEIKKAGAGSKEIQAFKDTLVAKLRDLDLDLPIENIENEVVGVINSIKSGLPVEDILKSSEILKKAMDDSGDAAKALKEAHDELRSSVGDLTENMKVSAEELANARYVDSGQAQADFGMFGNFAPGIARDYAQSDKGRSSIQKSRDILAMRNIPLVGESLGKLNDVVMDMEGPLGNAARAVGGLAGASAIATSILGSQLPQAFEALGLGQNATAAGVAGGLAEGGSMAASLATVGSQLFGPQGAVAGLLVGAITGAISGFAKAFRTKNLENKLTELNTTLEGVNKAFENLEKNRNAETIREAQGALGGLSKNFEELMLEAQRTPFEAVTSPIGIAANLGFSASLASIAIGFGELAVAGAAGASGAGAPAAPIFGISGGTKVAAGFAGLVTSIWASISATNPDEIDKEAFEAGLKTAEEYINGLQKLAEQEINLKSLETIKDTLDPIKEAYDKIEEDQKSGNITAEEAKTRRQNLNIQLGKQSAVIEQAQFSALAREGYTVDPLKPLADQLSTIDSRGQNIAQLAKDEAAYMAGVAELNRIYGEGSALARKEAEDKQKTTNRGYELLGSQYKQQLVQSELAATYRETRIEVENLIDKFDKVNAILNRFGTELDELSRQGDIFAGMGSGEAGLGPINRTNEAMLANMRAYSDAELAPIIEQVGRIAGGETGSQLTEGLQARRILQENLPDILTNVSGQDTERVESEVRALFDKAGLSEDLGRTFAEEVRKSLDQQTGSRQGKSFQELTQEFPALQESMSLIEKQFEVSSNTLKQYNDAIEQSNEFITRWGQSLEKSREITLRSAQLEIETRNKLLRATGGYVGPTQENEAFLEQIKSLTGGQGVKGNQILVDEIGRQYNDLSKQVEDQRAVVNATQDFAERQKQTKKLDELNRQMNNSYAALEEIANNTSMIDSLISAIERNRSRSEAAGRFVEDTFTSSPLEIAEDTLNLRMLNDFMDLDLDTARGKNRANRMFSSQENRQRIVAGLDYLEGSGMLGEQEMGRLRAEAQMQMIRQIQSQDPKFGKQKIVTMETIGDDNKSTFEKISVEEAVRRRAEGRYQDPLERRLEIQVNEQIETNRILREINIKTATEYEVLAQSINDMVSNLPGILEDAVSQARTESDARDSESPTSGDGSGTSAPPPEPEIFSDPDVAKIRAEIAAKDQEIGQVELELAKMRQKREDSWFDSRPSVVEKVKQEKLAELQKEQVNLKKQLDEAIAKQMDKQREEAGYTPLPPSDEEINKLQQKYQDSAKATNDAILELEKYKIANPGSKTGPYPGYPRGKSTPERERLEAKARSAELTELESRKRLEEAIRKREQYRQKEEEEFNIPPEWEPEKPTLPVASDQPIPVEVKNPILPSLPEIPGTGPMGGCCNEILDEIRLLKQALITNTFLMDLGNTISNAFTGVNLPLRLEPSSQDFLNSFSQSFNTYVTRLENALPDQIQIVGRHSVSVTISGGEVFNEMEGSIKRIVLSEVNKELTAYATKNGLPAPETRGNPVGE